MKIPGRQAKAIMVNSRRATLMEVNNLPNKEAQPKPVLEFVSPL